MRASVADLRDHRAAIHASRTSLSRVRRSAEWHASLFLLHASAHAMSLSTQRHTNLAWRVEGLYPKRHGGVKRVHRSKTLTCQKRATKTRKPLLPQFIEHSSRNAPKPLCISALAERAQARAARSSGHTLGCFSATYSIIAKESHTATSCSLSIKHGTKPDGENHSDWPYRAACTSVLPPSPINTPPPIR